MPKGTLCKKTWACMMRKITAIQFPRNYKMIYQPTSLTQFSLIIIFSILFSVIIKLKIFRILYLIWKKKHFCPLSQSPFMRFVWLLQIKVNAKIIIKHKTEISWFEFLCTSQYLDKFIFCHQMIKFVADEFQQKQGCKVTIGT